MSASPKQDRRVFLLTRNPPLFTFLCWQKKKNTRDEKRRGTGLPPPRREKKNLFRFHPLTHETMVKIVPTPSIPPTAFCSPSERCGFVVQSAFSRCRRLCPVTQTLSWMHVCVCIIPFSVRTRVVVVVVLLRVDNGYMCVCVYVQYAHTLRDFILLLLAAGLFFLTHLSSFLLSSLGTLSFHRCVFSSLLLCTAADARHSSLLRRGPRSMRSLRTWTSRRTASCWSSPETRAS